jgi:hypothetical protein
VTDGCGVGSTGVATPQCERRGLSGSPGREQSCGLHPHRECIHLRWGGVNVQVVACLIEFGNLMKLHLASPTEKYELSVLQEHLIYHDPPLCKPQRAESAEAVPEPKRTLRLPEPPDVRAPGSIASASRAPHMAACVCVSACLSVCLSAVADTPGRLSPAVMMMMVMMVMMMAGVHPHVQPLQRPAAVQRLRRGHPGAVRRGDGDTPSGYAAACAGDARQLPRVRAPHLR